MNDNNLGWSEVFAHQFETYRQADLVAGLITLEHKQLYMVATEAHGEIPAVVTGKLLHGAHARGNLPVVGDWVLMQITGTEAPQATIRAVLPRVSSFSRQAAGRGGGEQVVAANLAIAFLLTGLDGNYNLRRLERLLVQTQASQVRPVVVLTKADLRPNLEPCLREVQAVAGETPVHAISTLTGAGLAELDTYLQPGVTVALIGSSGVGKSTLLNHLVGNEVMRTQTVRATDSRGRHTTSHRQLFLLPSGAALMDTPGMRELQLWGDEAKLPETFPEIDALASECRFTDCRHTGEPGCAVQEALQTGALEAGRYANYQKMQGELQHLAAKTDHAAAQVINGKWKQIRKTARELNKAR